MIKPISTITKTEWRVWLPLAVFTFISSSLLMNGYPMGLLPEIKVPFIYGGDGLSYLWNAQRAIEGPWYFENARSGFPFGSNHLDYPTSDTGSYLVLKLLGWFLHSTIAAVNVYYLLGFSICAISTYLVARTLDVSRHFSIVVALIYTFTAFHFGRLGHLFFTWYFVAPLFFYVGFRLFSERQIFTWSSLSIKAKLSNAMGLMVLASFGIYYALFGCMVIVMCTILAAAWRRSWRRLTEGVVTLGFIILGVVLNVLPSLIHIFKNGENREGVSRLAGESELYALKITQLLLPRGDHRLDPFFEFTSRYNNSFPLITENMSASLGVLGSLGFLLLLATLVLSPVLSRAMFAPQKSIQTAMLQLRLQVFAAITLGLLLMATVGGFSSLFAMLISSSIRSWNRISIFIAFISVLALMLCIDQLIAKYIKPAYSRVAGITLALILVVLGIYDQTVRPCYTCISANKALIENDASFIQSIESALPPKAAIYQLPYMAYPENGPVNGLGSYDQARGVLNSKQLRWSFGGMRGRTDDWFFRKLAQLPIDQQITIVKAMGFAGIYIDHRGYVGAGENKRCKPFANSKVNRTKNNCLSLAELEHDVGAALGVPFNQQRMASKDAQLSFTPFYPLGTATPEAQTQDMSLANSYLRAIGFQLQNRMPVQIEGGFEEPLDLRKENFDFPHYAANVTGLSGLTIAGGVVEGRWSDALAAKHVTFWLSKPLPKKFALSVTAQASGLNAGKPMKVKIGKQVKDMVMGAAFSTQTVHFETTEPVYKIEFIPADPFSPARRWGADDTRLLAVQFQQLQVTPEP